MKQFRPQTENRGPYNEGLLVQLVVGGVVEYHKVPETANADWWDVEVVGSPPAEGGYSEQIEVLTSTVRLTYVATPRSLKVAREEKQAELNDRWNRALDDGVPVTVPNGGSSISAVVRYEELDRTRFSQVHDPAAVPAPGLLIRSITVINGRTRFMIAGAPKIQAVLDQTLAHRVQADDAWDRCERDIEDATSAAQVDAIDVDSYAWPKNTLA